MRNSFTVITVLPDLVNLDIEKDKGLIDGLMHWIKPSTIRYVERDECETTDAQIGRVTVRHVKGKIVRIEQEIQVALPEGINNGHEFGIALRKASGR